MRHSSPVISFGDDEEGDFELGIDPDAALYDEWRLKPHLLGNLLKTVRRKRKLTQPEMWTVSESSIAAFRARFLNLTMIEPEFGLQRNVSRSILNGAAVRPYLAGKENVGTLYLRIEVEEVLRAAGHSYG